MSGVCYEESAVLTLTRLLKSPHSRSGFHGITLGRLIVLTVGWPACGPCPAFRGLAGMSYNCCFAAGSWRETTEGDTWIFPSWWQPVPGSPMRMGAGHPSRQGWRGEEKPDVILQEARPRSEPGRQALGPRVKQEAGPWPARRDWGGQCDFLLMSDQEVTQQVWSPT